MSQIIVGEFIIDSGLPNSAFQPLQVDIDANAFGNLVFAVRSLAERGDSETDSTHDVLTPPEPIVDFSTGPWWVEPRVGRDLTLKSVTLLGTAYHVGTGALRGEMKQLDNKDHFRHWRIAIDPESVTGPPVPFPDAPLPDEGQWGDGLIRAAVVRRLDRVVSHIDLWLATQR